MVVSMDRWKGKVAIVTGASSGIGAAISQKLVEAGVKVAGIARRKEKVEDLAKKLENCIGKLYAVRADLTKEEDILGAFKWVKENLGPVHILVNNAGVLRQTTLVDGDTKFWKDVLDTNVLALCIATREAVRDMRANHVDGHIVHINSSVSPSISSIPNVNIYPASKYAVTALTETLRQEFNLLGLKIKVSSVSPGAVETEIFQASLQASALSTSESPVGRRVLSIAALQGSDIADAVCYVLGTPPHVQVHELIVRPTSNLKIIVKY